MNEQENIVLKPKQLIFANAIIEGKTQREAYKLAGYSCTDLNGIDSKAARLVSNGKVGKYIETQRKKLQDSLEKKVEVSKEGNLRYLLKAISIAESKDDPRGMVASVAEINKMQGYNAPQKNETTVLVKEINDLSVEELTALANTRSN